MNLDRIQHELDMIAADPRSFMNRLPDKERRGALPAEPPFSAATVIDGRYIDERDRVRALLYSPPEETLEEAAIGPDDRPENLVDRLVYTRAADIDEAGLLTAKLPESPWSDDYWAIYLGILGKRYADEGFPSSTDFLENQQYIAEHPVEAIVASGKQAAIDALSPSEKYDLLIGDDKGTLTRAMWTEGASYQEHKGKVETWMGICHGWAPAAYMLPRPRKTVTVLAADGKTTLHMYPSDIKGLGSLLWANGRSTTRFIGQRCNEKDPKTDANGRFVSASAFDNNPGSFHLCLVNQIGACKRGFVMDATFDYEVWNQPVFGYEMTYFNPMTMKAAPTLREATVARADFVGDRFKRYRSGCASIVGVSAEVRYVVETRPSHAPEDMPSRDAITKVTYCYDLELGEDGTIVGGEWYQNRHPDFLWTPPRGATMKTPWDVLAYEPWQAEAIMPLSWRMAARAASTRALPHPKIISGLLRLAGG